MRKQSGPAPRTVDGSAFATCPLCSRQVPLASINLHIDEELLSQAAATAAHATVAGEGAADAAAEVPETREVAIAGRFNNEPDSEAAAASSSAAADADADAKANATQAALQLRWRPDALPAGCKYGASTVYVASPNGSDRHSFPLLLREERLGSNARRSAHGSGRWISAARPHRPKLDLPGSS